MRKIKKDTKVYLIYFLLLFIALTALVVTIDEYNKEIVVLKNEIERLNKIKDNLLRQKQLYEEAISLHEELQMNLMRQIQLLEEENEQLRTIRAKLTAYSPLDNRDGQQAQGNPTRTSTGRRVGRRIAAADPKKLPYGTILEIPDYGIVEIQDTGGALRKDSKNIRIDLYHETYEEAMQFGVQEAEVKILKWGGNDN